MKARNLWLGLVCAWPALFSGCAEGEPGPSGGSVAQAAAAPAAGGTAPSSPAPSPDTPVAGEEGAGPPWFEEVAASAGIDFVHVSGAAGKFWAPESMGSGAAFFDYDGDRDLDLYVLQSGYLEGAQLPEQGRPGNRLFQNQGDGTFVDVTQSAGVGHVGYGMGAACGDYDRDGHVDLYVTNVGPNVLYRNKGDGTFEDVTERTRTGHAGWGTSSAFVDLDADGDLDLYVVNNYVWSAENEKECFSYYGAKEYCSPNNYNAPAPDVIYRNLGGGRFTESTAVSGIDTNFGNGLGIACGDYDQDGDVDVYIANDATPNQLWINQGEGLLKDEGLERGCAVNGSGTPEAGMGVQAIDIDNDGDLDLFLTHLRNESNTFYRNRGGIFSDATVLTRMLGRSLKFTGFGTGFCDFDLDGRLDLYVANGSIQAWKPRFDPEDAYAEPNLLFRGLGGVRFEEVLPEGGTAQPLLGASRGAAFCDYDDDGDMDVVVIERDAPLRLLRNVAPRQGGWIAFWVLDERGGVALGAQVQLEAAGTRQFRQVQVAYSYLSSNDPRVHFGLGSAASAERVEVSWPGGERELFGPFPAGKLEILRQGEGREP